MDRWAAEAERQSDERNETVQRLRARVIELEEIENRALEELEDASLLDVRNVVLRILGR